MPVRRDFTGFLHQPYEYDVLDSCRMIIEQDHLRPKMYLETAVQRVSPADAGWVVSGRQGDNATLRFATVGRLVVLCLNMRLGAPRMLPFPGDDTFGGVTRRGVSGDTNDLDWVDRRVVVLGMGAYAVENMRTALEHRASHVLILCRKRGSVSPKPIDWINNVRPVDDDYWHNPAGNFTQLALWRRAYETCGATSPECWEEGALKEPGHGISVGDIFFVGHHSKRVNVRLGEVERIEASGVVMTPDSKAHGADFLIKCVGFEHNFMVEGLLGRSHMSGTGSEVADNLHLQAEVFQDKWSHTDSVLGLTIVTASEIAAKMILSWDLDRPPPTVPLRIHHAKVSQLTNGIRFRLQKDVKLKELLHGAHGEVRERFQASASPYEFLCQHQREWEFLHRMLDRHVQPHQMAKYVFFRLLDILADEKPELLADRPSENSVTEQSRSVAAQPRPTTAMPAVNVSLERVLDAARNVIGPGTNVDADMSLMDAGLDSLGATALRELLQKAVGNDVEVPYTLVFDTPTPRMMMGELQASAPDATQGATASYEGSGVRGQIPEQEDTATGWVLTNHLASVLNDVFPTFWYSFPMAFAEASQLFEGFSSLRTSFVFNRRARKWRWVVGMYPRLQSFDRRADVLDFSDPSMPVFYESSKGNLWLNHSVWDGVSISLAIAGKSMRHLSAQEDLVTRLRATWATGDQVVNEILSGPKLFERLPSFRFCTTQVYLPQTVIEMVKQYSTRTHVKLELSWYAFVMVAALQGAQQASGTFWTQHSNRDADNMDVFGYVTTEVGYLIKVDPEASLEDRMSQAVHTLTATTQEHRNVFPEVAMCHALYDAFMETSLGMNLLGNGGPDWTDRSDVFDALKASAAQQAQSAANADAGALGKVGGDVAVQAEGNAADDADEDGVAICGNQNWIEIGLNNAISFKGRADVVDFCVAVLMPTMVTLCSVALGDREEVLARARAEATLTVEDRLLASKSAKVALDSEVNKPLAVPQRTNALVIGAGLAGLSIASIMSDAKVEFEVLEKSRSMGGQWRHSANFLSRVNSSEPSYRLPGVDRRQRNTNHSHYFEILQDILRLVQQKDLSHHLHIQSEVKSVVRQGDYWLAAGSQVAVQQFECQCDAIALCINRRLGRPREITYSGEDAFRGQVARGLSGDSDRLESRGARVVIVGMGAFAVECMRTTLERAAAHVTIVCRRRNSCAPQLMDWMRFVRPFDNKTVRTDAVGDAILYSAWQALYDDSGATRPECWAQGIVKLDGHALPISDIFFVAHALCLLESRVGQLARLSETAFVTQDGAELRAEIVLKCVGFEIQEGNERLLGRSHDRIPDPGAYLVYEPHLDTNVFHSLFVTSGHMNVSRFMGDLIVAALRRPTEVPTPSAHMAPRHRINLVTASEVAESFEVLLQSDAQANAAMLQNLHTIAGSFNSTMSPSSYLVHNETLWGGLHEMLGPLQTDCRAPRVLRYPFSSLLSALPGMEGGGEKAAADIGDGDGGRLYALHFGEQSLIGLTNPSIDCITFYEGSPPAELVQEQLTLMAEANPWLAGRLRRGLEGDVGLWVPKAADANVFFAEEHVEGLRADTPLPEVKTTCASLGVKLGLECIGEDAPFRCALFDLHLPFLSSRQRFANLLCLLHPPCSSQFQLSLPLHLLCCLNLYQVRTSRSSK